MTPQNFRNSIIRGLKENGTIDLISLSNENFIPLTKEEKLALHQIIYFYILKPKENVIETIAKNQHYLHIIPAQFANLNTEGGFPKYESEIRSLLYEKMVTKENNFQNIVRRLNSAEIQSIKDSILEIYEMLSLFNSFLICEKIYFIDKISRVYNLFNQYQPNTLTQLFNILIYSDESDIVNYMKVFLQDIYFKDFWNII